MLQRSVARMGTKYDAFSTGSDAWALSYVPNYGKAQSQHYGGAIPLSNVDEEKMKVRMTETALPTRGENCQTWITKVVAAAVRNGDLPSTATEAVKQVPTRPPGN